MLLLIITLRNPPHQITNPLRIVHYMYIVHIMYIIHDYWIAPLNWTVRFVLSTSLFFYNFIVQHLTFNVVNPTFLDKTNQTVWDNAGQTVKFILFCSFNKEKIIFKKMSKLKFDAVGRKGASDLLKLLHVFDIFPYTQCV